MVRTYRFLCLFSLVLCIVISLSGCIDSNSLTSSPPEVSSQTASVSTESNTESSEGAVSNNPPTGSAYIFSFDDLPEYTNKTYVALNNNTPVFTNDELREIGTEKYAPLDSLGRCGAAFAVCGVETMPTPEEERGTIGNIKPSGWSQGKYDFVDGKYLYNRCHLLGWQLTAENDNELNLITGTRYMNVQGMLPFENMIADYIKETGNHVAYRVTPRFYKDDLLASGVELEAYSVEDRGDGILFHVYVYNVQPGVTIDYKTGKNQLSSSLVNEKDTQDSDKDSSKTQDKPSTVSVVSKTESKDTSDSRSVYITPTGKRYHYSATCGGKNSYETDLENAKNQGLTPCKKCAS